MANTERWIRVLNDGLAEYAHAVNEAGLTAVDEEVLTTLTEARDKLIALLQQEHRLLLAKSFPVKNSGDRCTGECGYVDGPGSRYSANR